MRTFLVIVGIIVVLVVAVSWHQRREQQVADDDQARETDRTGIAAPDARGLYDCTCDYLTDTDLGGEERVRVCADGPQVAVQVGRGCAVRHSPGTVNRCTCVLWSRADCAEHECRQNR